MVLIPALNHIIIEELSETTVAGQYGYPINTDLPHLSALGFSDDTVLIGRDETSALALFQMAKQRFEEIGLNFNENKCKIINIKQGKLCEPITKLSFEVIKPNDEIKYLGISFTDEIVLYKQKLIKELQNKLQSVVPSTLLKDIQKFQILNSSVWPILNYSFQYIPSEKIPQNFLNDIDKMIKSAIKEILNLPSDIPDKKLKVLDF